jgi:Protein of unknown function (DUF2845)
MSFLSGAPIISCRRGVSREGMMFTRPVIILAFACAGIAQVQPAVAETLRCGTALIEPGDDARYVLEKCGEPTSSSPATAPVLGRDDSGNVYVTGIVRSGRWRYHRGPGQFPVVLTIGDDGRVESIEFEGHRD